MKSPCKKDCPDRHAGCHNKDCPHGWYEWDHKHRELKQRIWEDKQIVYTPSDWHQRRNKRKGGA